MTFSDKKKTDDTSTSNDLVSIIILNYNINFIIKKCKDKDEKIIKLK